MVFVVLTQAIKYPAKLCFEGPLENNTMKTSKQKTAAPCITYTSRQEGDLVMTV